MNWRKVLFILFMALGGLYFAYLEVFHIQEVRISEKDRSSVQLMPLPAELAFHSGKLDVTSHLQIVVKGHQDPQLEQTISWFEERLKSITGFSLEDPTDADQLIIICDTARSAVQQLAENESYSLHVFSHGARLRAPTPYGIIRGLETILQLVHEQEGSFFVQAVEIKDKPRYSWRGLMIDVARHWLPKDIILRNLEAMAAVKLNVLHLHLTDDQAWRIESKVFPKLHQFGSGGNFYTHDDIQEIVAFATQRGIRVLPELEMPGHCSSWLVGYPELASGPGPFQLETRLGNFDSALDPTNEEVYQFIDKIIGEWAQLFPDTYLHIGGDQVNPGAWSDNQEISSFKENKGYKNHKQLQSYFASRVKAIVSKYGRKPVGWDDLQDAGLGTGAVIQSWRGKESVLRALEEGNPSILSGEYFLDRKLPASYHYSISPDLMTEDMSLDARQKQMILGGEACMWTHVVNAGNIDSRIWPRMAAIAEKLWSPSELTQNPVDMYRRLSWISHYLDYSGATHNSNYPASVESLCPPENRVPLRTFIDALEELRSYDRIALDTSFRTTTPLERVVDVARPESLVAVNFNILVTDFLEFRDLERAKKIRTSLEKWASNHGLLSDHFVSCEKLKEVQELSEMLAQISQLGLTALTTLESNDRLPGSQLSQKIAYVDNAAIGRAGVIIAVAESIRKLLNAAHGEMGTG